MSHVSLRQHIEKVSWLLLVSGEEDWMEASAPWSSCRIPQERVIMQEHENRQKHV